MYKSSEIVLPPGESAFSWLQVVRIIVPSFGHFLLPSENSFLDRGFVSPFLQALPIIFSG